MSRWLQNVLPILAVVTALLILSITQREPESTSLEVVGAVFLDPPHPLDPFLLVDQHGTALDRSRLEGRWTLLFFGYTHCSSACSTILTALAAAQEQLAVDEEGSEELQGIFISVDPERDTPEVISQYLDSLHATCTGVVGEPTALAGLADQFGVMWPAKLNQVEGDYPIQLDKTIFVIDPDANWIASILPPLDTPRIVEAVREIRNGEGNIDAGSK